MVKILGTSLNQNCMIKRFGNSLVVCDRFNPLPLFLTLQRSTISKLLQKYPALVNRKGPIFPQNKRISQITLNQLINLSYDCLIHLIRRIYHIQFINFSSSLATLCRKNSLRIMIMPKVPSENPATQNFTLFNKLEIKSFKNRHYLTNLETVNEK